MNSTNYSARRQAIRIGAKLTALFSGGAVMSIIPFSCGQPILHLVTPWLLDDTSNILDTIVKAVAPLVLP